MSTSRQSFSQVKDLLKKLDQSIEDAQGQAASHFAGAGGQRDAQRRSSTTSVTG